MTQIATVKRLLDGGRAEILVHRQSACGHSCEACGGCGPEAQAKVAAVAENPPAAQPGDTVLVESESGRVLSLAAALYLFPVLLLFVGYFIAKALGLGEGGSLGVGLGCMAAAFLADWRVDRRLRAGRPLQMRIVEVLRRCSDM
ncbi:MAG: SoxR reducing system RseC family protein [Oscillospiraceae bacterium]|nr:SoxR reducing system RseC family protein [Oscillospiraceae bacterium]MCD8376544.1 SoxR reducing system RseC family protein [Oscillospiraceae bacterium]